METNLIIRKKVAPILRTMKIGQFETYPMIQKTSVESTRQRLQSQFKHLGIKFAIRMINDDNIQVTRIA